MIVSLEINAAVLFSVFVYHLIFFPSVIAAAAAAAVWHSCRRGDSRKRFWAQEYAYRSWKAMW